MAFPPPALAALITTLATLLKSTSSTISFTETACGGLISASLLSTPGASKIYKGGLTLYTLPSRIAFGGWTEGPTASGAGRNRQPGYLAVAVVGPGGYERALEWESGSAERSENMLLFARRGIELVIEAIEEQQKAKAGNL